MSGTTCCALNGHNSINNNVFSRFNDVNLFLSTVSECSVPPGVGPQGGCRMTATTMVVGALTKCCDYNGHKNINNEKYLDLKAHTCRAVCWLILLCLSVETGVPRWPWDDGGHHGRGLFFYLASA